jgi:hypothetical protein
MGWVMLHSPPTLPTESSKRIRATLSSHAQFADADGCISLRVLLREL